MSTKTQQEHEFKIPFYHPFLLACVLLVLMLFVLLMLLLLFPGINQRQAIAILLVSLLGVSVVAIPIAITTSIYRLSVDAQGIKGRNNYFAPFRLSWADIVAVKPIRIPGYPYLLLSTPTYRAVWWEARYWIPLFLTDMVGFRSAITKYADPDHPLRRYLERRSDDLDSTERYS